MDDQEVKDDDKIDSKMDDQKAIELAKEKWGQTGFAKKLQIYGIYKVGIEKGGYGIVYGSGPDWEKAFENAKTNGH